MGICFNLEVPKDLKDINDLNNDLKDPKDSKAPYHPRIASSMNRRKRRMPCNKKEFCAFIISTC